MAEIALVKRVKYAGDVYKRLLEGGFDIDNAVLFLEGIPDADVAPVVHGRWEKWNGDDRHHCNVCECYANAERDSYGYIAYEFLDNYCPNCGAQMHDDDFCSYGERKEDKAE